MTYYVYILKSLHHDWFYVSLSQDVKKRLIRHNRGRVKATKAYRPYKVLLMETFPDRKSARLRENYYKTGFGRKVWMEKIGIGCKNHSEHVG